MPVTALLGSVNFSRPAPVQEQQGGSSATAVVPRAGVVRSATSAKETILAWVQQQVNHYNVSGPSLNRRKTINEFFPMQNVNVTNFSTAWNDGLAFCALIHNFYPEAFDFDKLDARNRRYNFTLAFKAAE
jgi:hypothetical protein